MLKYDILVMGAVSKDINIDHLGNSQEIYGGAVLYSSYAAAAGGSKVAALIKMSGEEKAESTFDTSKMTLFLSPSKKTTSIRNVYHTADKERRTSTAISVADPVVIEDIPNLEADIYHLAGLVNGDFDEELMKTLSEKGKVAVDIQGFLRCVESDGSMVYRDWSKKLEYSKYITYFKADAAEAEILTGLSDRYEAAKAIYGYGCKEVVISHHSEMLAYNGDQFYSCPIRSRNLSGRTGRGDTFFAAYITERQKKDMKASLIYATAAVSLKMENPSPFKGSREDVMHYIKELYIEYCN